VVEIVRLAREREHRAAFDNRVGGLRKEEGLLAIGVRAHLARMIGIVLADAENAPHGKAPCRAGNRDRGHLDLRQIHYFPRLNRDT